MLVFEHKLLYGSKGPRSEKGAVSPVGEVPEEEYLVPIGKARLHREGSTLSIITYGAMVYVAETAAARLEKEGISIEIIDLRTLLPLDWDMVLASVKKTSKAIVLHEDTLTGGIGGEIAARITEHAFEYLDGPVIRIAAPDTPVPYSPPLEEAFLPNAAKVIEKARWLAAY